MRSSPRAGTAPRNSADKSRGSGKWPKKAPRAAPTARGKPGGTTDPNWYVTEQKSPPLTVAEHLEMLALGERIARYYRHPSQVDSAVKAGASWAQVGAATGTSAEAARAAYREWAEGQHRLHAGGYGGLDDEEYAAAIEAARTGAPGG